MIQADVLGLANAKVQIFDGIVRRVAVNMVHHLLGVKKAPEMRFHHGTMLQHTGKPRFLHVRRVRMSGDSNDKYITISSGSPSPLPSGGQFACLAEHRVCRADHPLAKHWVLRAGDVSMVRGILVGQIPRCYCATLRAIQARRARIVFYVSAALTAVRCQHNTHLYYSTCLILVLGWRFVNG